LRDGSVNFSPVVRTVISAVCPLLFSRRPPRKLRRRRTSFRVAEFQNAVIANGFARTRVYFQDFAARVGFHFALFEIGDGFFDRRLRVFDFGLRRRNVGRTNFRQTRVSGAGALQIFSELRRRVVFPNDGRERRPRAFDFLFNRFDVQTARV
jgi:hypothetical protein